MTERPIRPAGLGGAASCDVVIGRGLAVLLACCCLVATYGWAPAPAAAAVTASFTFSPQAPADSEPMTFTSTSASTAAGPLTETWALDGDGVFDDSDGPEASAAFPAGPHIVQLKVIDSESMESIATETVEVGGDPAAVIPPPVTVPVPVPGSAAPPGVAPAIAPTQARTTPLTPFPVVRIVRRRSGARTIVRLLTFTAPPTASVSVRCRGGGCPFARQKARLFAGGELLTPGASKRTLTVRAFAGHSLRPGTQIRVFITDPLHRGKYARFTLRAGKAPQRIDRCTTVGREVVVRCTSFDGSG